MENHQSFPHDQEIAATINEHIGLWLKEKDRLIIGIDGYSASGKTTIADFVVKENTAVTVIHLDDLLRTSEERVSMMSSAQDRSKVFELSWYRYDVLDEIAAKFRHSAQYSIEVYDYDLKKSVTKIYDLSKPVLIIEGIFLFHPEHAISKAFDKRIYLDVDFQIADGRRENREKKRWGSAYVDENHPDSFVKPFKEAYRRYFRVHNPIQSADLVIKIN